MTSPKAHPPILLVGAGAMARDYAAVLQSLSMPFIVFGRGTASAEAFRRQTGITPGTGALETQIAARSDLPDAAIVAVNAEVLADVTKSLIAAGIRRVLVEKPAALDLDELTSLKAAADAAEAKIYIAYNRRFMASVLKADEIIAEDGGIVSVRFDFTEASARIAGLAKPRREFETWFYGNSTHVIDLAFHFFGRPETLCADVAGKGALPWHPSGAVYSGYGRRDGAIIAWHSNWLAPGRWGVEVMTAKHKLILQPLEKLRVQSHGSFAEVETELDDSADRDFKPGLLKQTRAFLFMENAERLQTLDKHAAFAPYYEKIRTGCGPNR